MKSNSEVKIKTSATSRTRLKTSIQGISASILAIHLSRPILSEKVRVNISKSFALEENGSSLPKLPNHRMPQIMKSVEAVPYFDEFDGKKGNYEKYMESVVNENKTKRQEKLVS
jgi:hypothetical protein